MTYEELLISIDLNGYENVLPFIGRLCLNNSHWFVVCDEGDCHLFNRYGNEDDISKIKEIYEDIIPKDIKKIVIPNSVTHIRIWAFYGCIKLTSTTIANSVTSIREYVFSYCDKLMNVIINKPLDQVKSMENYPFGIEDESIIKCN